MRRLSTCVALSLFACLPARGDTVDRIAATVNDTAIPESELRKAMVISALERQPGEDLDGYRARVLDALIEQHLEYEDAVRFGPAPPDAAEIKTAVQRLRDRILAEGKDPDSEFAQAGLTPEEVRASLERQLVIARYLRERFAPISYADEEQARAEYEKTYVPERQAAGLPAEPFATVSDQMRKRSSERAFDQEVAKWLQELRQKARIAIYRIPVPIPTGRTPVALSGAPTARTPKP